MTTKTPAVERVAASMYVSFDHTRGRRIEAYLSYHTEWRGQPAAVSMSGDRYTVSDGTLTDWRVYADRAVAGRYRTDATPEGELGDHLTDTARHRLSDACKPDALAWLASDEGAAELREAHYRAGARELVNGTTSRHHRNDGARLLERWGDHMGEHVDRFRELVAAWEAWCDAAEKASA